MKPILFCLATLSAANLCAQDATPPAETKPWTRAGLMALNFSQTYLENWQGGGQNAINGTVIVNYKANYAKDSWTWDNTFDGAYGLTRLGKVGNLQKTDDRVEINSKVGRTTPLINTYWAALFTFRTQWDAGYDYTQTPSPLISNPFAPAYILIGTGIDFKPEGGFSAYISPVTNKTTIVNNQRLADAGAFGVEAATYDAAGVKTADGQIIRYEVGGFVKLQYIKTLIENVQLTTKAELFSNYLQNPQNIDVNWETLIAMKVNKYLSANLSTHLIYDDDVRFAVDRNDDGITDGSGPRVQLKEVFSLGIQYQF